MKFQIGDTVQADPACSDGEFYGSVHAGDYGTVVSIESCDLIGVDWGRNVGGHDCGCSNVRPGHATWELADQLLPADAIEDVKIEVEIENVNLEEIL